MRRFLAAVGFLTIIPTGNRSQEEELHRSMVFFPLVGLMIGGFLVLVKFLGSQIFSPPIVCTLVIAAWVVITGCLHLDGFCDTIDGLAGGSNKEEILRIMGDSAVGAKGVVAVILLLLMKVSLVNASYPLLIAPVMGRWAMVVGAAISSYPKSCGLGKTFIDQCGKRESLFATLIMITIGIALFKLSFFCLLGILGIALTIILLFVLYIKKKIGGLTGDTLGALGEVIEVATLLSVGFVSC